MDSNKQAGDSVIFCSDFLTDQNEAIITLRICIWGPHSARTTPGPSLPTKLESLSSTPVGVEVARFEKYNLDAGWRKITCEKDAISPGDADGYLAAFWRINDHAFGLMKLK
ncbi:hypothetical protein RJZ57_004483 [Blastomyces gilchristii]